MASISRVTDLDQSSGETIVLCGNENLANIYQNPQKYTTKTTFYSKIPYIIDYLNLRPSEFYVYYKIRQCLYDDQHPTSLYENDIARMCDLSASKISKILKTLSYKNEKLNNKSLISIEKCKSAGEAQKRIFLNDISQDNLIYVINQANKEKS